MFASFKSRSHTKTVLVPKMYHRQTWHQKFLRTYLPLASGSQQNSHAKIYNYTV